MYITKKKELFSIAFVKSIASVLGFNPSKLEVDDDSIDLYLSAKGYEQTKIRNPQLQLQLKCTKKTPGNDGFLHFPLSIKNYNDLRGDNVLCPRYLIVITIPNDLNNWIHIDKDKLILYKCGYWLSLKNAPDNSNEDSVTVKIPISNLLTVNQMKILMDKASMGESI